MGFTVRIIWAFSLMMKEQNIIKEVLNIIEEFS